MTVEKHIVIFSHGFGVCQDDRGLFVDIGFALGGIKTVMFDYNEVDVENNILTVRPFSEQVKILKEVVEGQRSLAPDATIDLVCHSQGCLVAALAQLSGIRKTILIAPPTDMDAGRTLSRYRDNPKAEINLEGVTKLPRTDGSTTIVPAEYWHEREKCAAPIDLYNELAGKTELAVIKAKQDHVLGSTSFDGLDKKVEVIELDGDHDFTTSRNGLCKVISGILF